MAKTKTYAKVNEATEIIEQLCEKYPDTFWAVKPRSIVVMGIDNVDRTEKAVAKTPIWSRLRNVKGVELAIFQEHNISECYIIEVYWSDWNVWTNAIKAAVIANHLLEVTPDMDTTNKPDCVGFKILYKALGVNWEREPDGAIPNLLVEDIEFDLDLRPGLAEMEAMEGGDEIEDRQE